MNRFVLIQSLLVVINTGVTVARIINGDGGILPFFAAILCSIFAGSCWDKK